MNFHEEYHLRECVAGVWHVRGVFTRETQAVDEMELRAAEGRSGAWAVERVSHVTVAMAANA